MGRSLTAGLMKGRFGPGAMEGPVTALPADDIPRLALDQLLLLLHAVPHLEIVQDAHKVPAALQVHAAIEVFVQLPQNQSPPRPQARAVEVLKHPIEHPVSVVEDLQQALVAIPHAAHPVHPVGQEIALQLNLLAQNVDFDAAVFGREGQLDVCAVDKIATDVVRVRGPVAPHGLGPVEIDTDRKHAQPRDMVVAHEGIVIGSG